MWLKNYPLIPAPRTSRFKCSNAAPKTESGDIVRLVYILARTSGESWNAVGAYCGVKRRHEVDQGWEARGMLVRDMLRFYLPRRKFFWMSKSGGFAVS